MNKKIASFFLVIVFFVALFALLKFDKYKFTASYRDASVKIEGESTTDKTSKADATAATIKQKKIHSGDIILNTTNGINSPIQIINNGQATNQYETK